MLYNNFIHNKIKNKIKWAFSQPSNLFGLEKYYVAKYQK